MDPICEDPALAAYESFAPFYDQYTHDYAYEPWLANIEQAALEHGLRGNRLLDVGCGTGKSFLPMLYRGYEVTACDISPAMVARARAAAGADAEVLVADARCLPVLGRFDLVTSIDDALNYLLSDEELAMAFEGVARNLRPGGIFAFDLNTLGAYQSHFPGDTTADIDGTFFCWRRLANGPVDAGATFTAIVEVFATEDGECWHRSSSTHVQRHHPHEVIHRLLGDAGLELVAVYGQREGGRLERCADPFTCMKVDYFARRLRTLA
jgi:SAM-dependent methyltransferase